MGPTIGVVNDIKSCDRVVFISLLYNHMRTGGACELAIYVYIDMHSYSYFWSIRQLYLKHN